MKKWCVKEERHLLNEYRFSDINEIGVLHRRSPSDIAFQLVKLHRIARFDEARGFNDYKKTRVYRQLHKKIIETEKEKEPKVLSTDELFDIIGGIRLTIDGLILRVRND